MTTEREFHEAIARCVSIMVYFHNIRRSPSAKTAMIAEVHLIATWFSKLELSAGELDRRLFKMVEDELVVRYSRSIGIHLNADFVSAFASENSTLRAARPLEHRVMVSP